LSFWIFGADLNHSYSIIPAIISWSQTTIPSALMIPEQIWE